MPCKKVSPSILQSNSSPRDPGFFPQFCEVEILVKIFPKRQQIQSNGYPFAWYAMTTGSIGHGHILNPRMQIPHDPMDTWTLGFLNLVWNLYFTLSKQYILVIQPTKWSKPGMKIFLKKNSSCSHNLNKWLHCQIRFIATSSPSCHKTQRNKYNLHYFPITSEVYAWAFFKSFSSKAFHLWVIYYVSFAQIIQLLFFAISSILVCVSQYLQITTEVVLHSN